MLTDDRLPLFLSEAVTPFEAKVTSQHPLRVRHERRGDTPTETLYPIVLTGNPAHETHPGYDLRPAGYVRGSVSMREVALTLGLKAEDVDAVARHAVAQAEQLAKYWNTRDAS